MVWTAQLTVVLSPFVGVGSLACGGSVDGDTSKGFHERGATGKEVYYTLKAASGDKRTLYQFALSNFKRLSGGNAPEYVTVFDSSWKTKASRSHRHVEVTLEPSKTYYVLVEGYNSADAGTFTLTASCEAPGTSQQGTWRAHPEWATCLWCPHARRAGRTSNTLPSSCGAVLVWTTRLTVLVPLL